MRNNSSFLTRVISSIGLVLYFAIFFIFSWLGDTHNNWSHISSDYKHIFSWLTILFFIPIILLANIEVNKIYFQYNKRMYAFTAILSFITILPPIIVMSCINYDFLKTDNETFIYLLTIFISLVFSSLLLSLITFLMGLRTYQIFIELFLFQIFNFFVISFFYFSFIKSWSTLLIVFLLPVLTDTFAYLGGMLFGRKKLAPYTSPKKTIEGAIIGVFFAVGVSLIILTIFAFTPSEHNMLKNFFGVNFKERFNTILPDNQYSNKPLWWVNSTIILLFLSVFSIIGDLSFSAVKRKYKIKDFSNLIPGHGGILDRFDSHTFVYSAFFVITIGIGFFADTIGVF